jgi:Tol biopolymer transport system component
METGEERELFPVPGLTGHPTCQLRWSPDGHSILCEHTSWPLRLIDVETGNLTTIPKTDSRVHGCAWSPDGKTIYYIGVDVSNEVGDWPCRIVAYELATGEVRELCMGVSDRSLAISPDGQHLAFLKWPGLKVIPTAGGEPRTILEFHGDYDRIKERIFPLKWTPDGHHLLFQKDRRSPDGSHWMHELWRVPAEGGETQKIQELESRPGDRILSLLSLHPGEQRIAFAKGQYYGHTDLWVMENLLTTSAADK